MTMREKRKYERVDSLNLSYVCIDEDGRAVSEGMGRTLNVSEAGILLEISFYIQPAQSLSLTIAIEEDLIDISGKVIRCEAVQDGVYHAGIEFIEPDVDARQILKKFIKFFKNRMQQAEE